jgi:hypothetical protein
MINIKYIFIKHLKTVGNTNTTCEPTDPKQCLYETNSRIKLHEPKTQDMQYSNVTTNLRSLLNKQLTKARHNDENVTLKIQVNADKV